MKGSIERLSHNGKSCENHGQYLQYILNVHDFMTFSFVCMHACMYVCMNLCLILNILTLYATEKHGFEPEIRYLSFQILVAIFLFSTSRSLLKRYHGDYLHSPLLRPSYN